MAKAAPAQVEEKVVAPPLLPEKLDNSIAVVQDPPNHAEASSSSSSSTSRDATLARLETEKKRSIIKAWEESEKSKAENKAQKKMASVLAWENSKKASLEADLKKNVEKLEKRKAENVEKLKNKIAMVHMEGEEKRAMIQARHREEMLKAEEAAEQYRATGQPTKKSIFASCGA